MELLDASWPQRMRQLLSDGESISVVLTGLAKTATSVVSAPVSCGLTLRLGGVEDGLSMGASDPRAELLDETQYRMNAGPCLQSMETGELVEIADTHAERRWADYVERAVGVGLRCSLSIPLTIADETFGALNVYGFDRSGLFGPEERVPLERFAAQAAVTMRLEARLGGEDRLLGQMEEALRSRADIDQALGIIMATQRCSAQEAFDILREQSQRTHTRVQDLVVDLITRTSGQAPDRGRPFRR